MHKNKSIIITIIIVGVLAILGFIIYKSHAKDKSINQGSVTNNTNTNNNQNSTTTENATNTNQTNQTNTNMENENTNYTEASLETSLGKITFKFATDKPLTVGNFIKLAKSGFYDGVKFHRVIKGFMIQTGDPLSKDDANKNIWGTGGPGYKFADELTGQEKYTMGTVAMANSGPNTNGSQFFIMTSNTPLPPNYTVFAEVVAGQDVAQQIQDVSTDSNDRPLQDITINKVNLE